MEFSLKKAKSALINHTLSSIRKKIASKSVQDAENRGESFGRLIFYLSKRRREIALSNLALAFPELTPQERSTLAKKNFEHFGRMLGDFFRSEHRTKEELDQSIKVFGLEHLESALSLDKGCLMITGHIGNWERSSAWLSSHGYPLSVVAQELNHPKLNEMICRLREKNGTRVILRGNSIRPILEGLKNKELIGLLPDQSSDEIFLPFFGKPCGSTLGPGVIASRTKAPVVPCWCIWKAPGQYHLIFEPALEPVAHEKIKGEGITRSIQATLEQKIREYPDQWLWFHDRWKSARRRGLI